MRELLTEDWMVNGCQAKPWEMSNNPALAGIDGYGYGYGTGSRKGHWYLHLC